MSRNFDKNKVQFLSQTRNLYNLRDDGDLHLQNQNTDAKKLIDSFIKPEMMRRNPTVDYEEIKKIYAQNDRLDNLKFFRDVNNYIKANDQGPGSDNGMIPPMLMNRNYMPQYTDIHNLRKKMLSGTASYQQLESLRRKDFLHTYYQKTKRNLQQILDVKNNYSGEFNRALLVRSTNNPVAPTLMDATFNAYKTIGILFGKFRGEVNENAGFNNLYLDFNNFELPKKKSDLIEDIILRNRYTDNLGRPGTGAIPTNGVRERTRKLSPIEEEEEEEEEEGEEEEEEEEGEGSETGAEESEMEGESDNEQEQARRDYEREVINNRDEIDKTSIETQTEPEQVPTEPIVDDRDRDANVDFDISTKELQDVQSNYFQEFTTADIENIIEYLKAFYALPQFTDRNGEFFIDFNETYQNQCRDFLNWLASPGAQLRYQYRMLNVNAMAKLHFVDEKKSIVTNESLTNLFANVCNLKWKIIDTTNHFVSRAENYLGAGENPADVVKDVFYNKESRITRSTLPVSRYLVGKYNVENTDKIYLRDPTTVADDVELKREIVKMYNNKNIGALLLYLYKNCAQPLITNTQDGELEPVQFWGKNNSGDKNKFIVKSQKLLQILYEIPFLCFNIFDANFIKRHLQYKINSKRNIMDVLDVDDPTNPNSEEIQYQGILNWWNSAILDPSSSLKDSGDKIMFLSAVSMFLDKNLDVFGVKDDNQAWSKKYDIIKVLQSVFKKNYFGDYFYSFFTDRMFLLLKNTNIFSDELSYAFLGLATLPVIAFTAVYLGRVKNLAIIQSWYSALGRLIESVLKGIVAYASERDEVSNTREIEYVQTVERKANKVKEIVKVLKDNIRQDNFVVQNDKSQQYVYPNEPKVDSSTLTDPLSIQSVSADTQTYVDKKDSETQMLNYFTVDSSTNTDNYDPDGPAALAAEKTTFKNFGAQFNPFMMASASQTTNNTNASATQTSQNLVQKAVQSKVNAHFNVATQMDESFHEKRDISYDAREIQKRKEFEEELKTKMRRELELEKIKMKKSFETQINAVQDAFVAERGKLLAQITDQPMDVEVNTPRPTLTKVFNPAVGFMPDADVEMTTPKLVVDANTQTASTNVMTTNSGSQTVQPKRVITATQSVQVQDTLHEEKIKQLTREQLQNIQTIVYLQQQNQMANQDIEEYKAKINRLATDFELTVDQYKHELKNSERAGAAKNSTINQLNEVLNEKEKKLNDAERSLNDMIANATAQQVKTEETIRDLVQKGAAQEAQIANVNNSKVTSGTQTEAVVNNDTSDIPVNDKKDALLKFKEKLKKMQVTVVENDDEEAKNIATEGINTARDVTLKQINALNAASAPSNPNDVVGQFLYNNRQLIKARTRLVYAKYTNLGTKKTTASFINEEKTNIPRNVVTPLARRTIKLIVSDNPLALASVIKDITASIKSYKVNPVDSPSPKYKVPEITISTTEYEKLVRAREALDKITPKKLRGVKRKNVGKVAAVRTKQSRLIPGQRIIKKGDLLKYDKVKLSKADKKAIELLQRQNAQVTV